MDTYYVKMLLFTILINTLVLPYYENYQNNHYNIHLIPKNTQRTIIKSRLLAQTQNHNPHYHNDPELKEIIDKLNEEAIKKYQQTHDPYEQLQELVEKNGTKLTGGNGAEPMSTTEKELFETYEELFGKGNHMLKSGMYPYDNDKSDKSSIGECTDIDNTKLANKKGKDKYLVNLKERCKGGIGFCSVGSILLTLVGLIAARATAVAPLNYIYNGVNYSIYATYITILNMFNDTSMITAINTGAKATVIGLSDLLTPSVASSATAIFQGCGIAALVLLILAIILIILYIWLYRRRKNSWKHECKKHLCR
ncbi:stevor [Plasmodium falciparum IGH-CR14]|uniref:Stevor n=1 Tax=Plasmodium falciparum IGH-CR14 TaxID=580059 RepID=A0A0L1IG19_PLAFA|nr:stevor [Plasmodium falciparum IGH-CR14]